MSKKIIIAVDGGATKTTLVVRDSEGNTLFEKSSTGSNYHAIGIERVEKVLTELIHDAYKALSINKIDVAAFAIAGIDTEHDLSIVKVIVENSCNNVPVDIHMIIVENDVHSTLIGVTEGKAGALIVSGTGSIAYAYDGKGQSVRTGGWGHRAADEGSGYWIGQQIIKAIVRCEDGRSTQPTILKELLYEKFQYTNLEQLLAWIYHPKYTNAQLASVSSILSEAVALGDDTATLIARDAAKELSLLAITALRKINYKNEPFKVYLNGGILKNHSIIRNLFQQYTLDVYPNISFVLCEENPIEYIIKRAYIEMKP